MSLFFVNFVLTRYGKPKNPYYHSNLQRTRKHFQDGRGSYGTTKGLSHPLCRRQFARWNKRSDRGRNGNFAKDFEETQDYNLKINTTYRSVEDCVDENV